MARRTHHWTAPVLTILLGVFVVMLTTTASPSHATLGDLCKKISEWKPGTPGPDASAYDGEMDLVDTAFVRHNMGTEGWLFVDARGESDVAKGTLKGAVSLRTSMKPEEPDDFKDAATVLKRLQQATGNPKLTDGELKNLRYMLYCNGAKCPRSARAGCRLRELGVPATNVHLIPLSFEELVARGFAKAKK